MTFAHGAIVVSASGVTGNPDLQALSVIDGNVEGQPLVEGTSTPMVSLVLQLPAPTSFDRFAVPRTPIAVTDQTLFQTVMIEGSEVGAEGPWVSLAQTELRSHLQTAEMVPASDARVSWIRLTLSGALEESRTVVFSELVGNGTQDPVPFEERFTGSWEVRPFDQPDAPGRSLSLTQSGSVISGCLGDLLITGTVDGAVARALAADSGAGRARAFLFVADADRELIVALTDDADSLAPRQGIPSTGEASCDAPPAAPPSCGSTVHILFDVDSAEIRRDSERVLDDLFTGLRAEAVSSITIVGHTSTEGDADYNQDLSERRAAAVVSALIARGIDAGLIDSEGRGETEPLLVPDPDEASRSLNRRVEVSCIP